MSVSTKPENIIADFIKVCEIAQIKIKAKDISVLDLKPGAEHKDTASQKDFTAGKSAVYVFVREPEGECYKAGKINKNSSPRLLYQHYNPIGAKSNLANSLYNDVSMAHVIGNRDIGTWIKENTRKIIFCLFKETKSKNDDTEFFALNLLEAFLQARVKPKYEGFKSLRKGEPENP
jgi:hypothetical protein